MQAMKIITKALDIRQTALSEYDSELFCSSLGIPVCREAVAYDADSAVTEAVKIGFPIVLKGSGKSLFHKTDVGAIVFNLTTEEEVRKESCRLLKIQGAEAILVQETVKGCRELVCGLIRDAHFGPCVMFGLGGILTNVLQDVVFRVAPLTSRDAQEMAEEIQHKKVMGLFRGEAAVDMDALSQILVRLGEIGLKYKDIHAIDINPLKIRPDGKPVVVDALITLSGAKEQYFPTQLKELSKKNKNLNQFFKPESVAIIGASNTPGKAGYVVIQNILANGYAGEIYPVNPKGGEILGMEVYPSIASLPEGIDLAILVIPAKDTVKAVRECATKGITAIVISAGGFSEVDNKGLKLEEELAQAIAETGSRVVGPNTSGHISTPHKFSSSLFPLGKIPRGNISYIAQTGNFATHTMRYIITNENFGVARVIGLGNEINIDECDALHYYVNDSETLAIFMYLESIKRPRYFLQVASKATRTKPLILLKGGNTKEGFQAAVTHTAALALDERVIDGALKQAGITRIYKYSHLILAAKALACMPIPKGNRVGFLAPSGAMLVVLSDLCYQRWGLDIPELCESTRQRLQEISPSYIRMRNPVDIWPSASVHGIEFSYREAIEILMRDTNIDAIVAILMLTDEFGVPPSLDFIVKLAKKYPEKPLYVTFSGERKHMEESKSFLEPRGVPTFPLIEEPFEVISILNRCRKAMEQP